MVKCLFLITGAIWFGTRRRRQREFDAEAIKKALEKEVDVGSSIDVAAKSNSISSSTLQRYVKKSKKATAEGVRPARR